MKASVNPIRCPQNHRCPAIRVCPVGAMSQKGFSLPKIDTDKCTGCKLCTRFCPTGAISVKV